MFLREDKKPRRETFHARGGEGTVFMTDFLSKEDACQKGRLFTRLTLPQGASMGMHRHEGEFEVYYFLTGEALVGDGEREIPMHPGDMYLCRDGEQHALKNAGNGDLELIAIILYA